MKATHYTVFPHLFPDFELAITVSNSRKTEKWKKTEKYHSLVLNGPYSSVD